MAALERRFLASGEPRGITSIHPVGLGDGGDLGAGHFAHDGLLKRIVCGTFVNSPKISDLAVADKIEAYTLPQGVLSQLMREIAAGRPGLLTQTGLHTFVDPRHGGGRQSRRATEDLVELVTFRRRGVSVLQAVPDRRLLPARHDRGRGRQRHHGEEAIFGEMLSMAQATRRCGGLVIVQVKRMAERGTLPAKAVKIPGILVDLVVVEPEQRQTYETDYSPSYAGELRVPLSDIPALPLDARKIDRAPRRDGALPGRDLQPRLRHLDRHRQRRGRGGRARRASCLTNEQGLIGGAPASGNEAGAARNYAAMIDQPYQFDFYDGGGLDLAFLSFAEVDREGNVNVSRFGGRSSASAASSTSARTPRP